MPYDDRNEERRRDERFRRLEDQKTNQLTLLQNWVDNLVQLRADSPAEDQASATALLDAFKAEGAAILNAAN